MRQLAIAFWIVALVPGLTLAQGDCFDCVLGLWEDPALTVDRGTIQPNELKDIYLGIKLDGTADKLVGVEFSVAGLSLSDGLILVGAVPLGPRALVWGTVPAPADTSVRSTGDGGVTVAWSSCLSGTQALMKLTVFTTSPVVDKVLVVKRSYPPTDPGLGTPLMFSCDPPVYTARRVTGGCYVLNWSGSPVPCVNSHSVMAVQNETWGAVKTMFR